MPLIDTKPLAIILERIEYQLAKNNELLKSIDKSIDTLVNQP